MDSFNREQYLEQLRMYYSGDRDDTEKFLEEMGESLDCYLETNPAATTAEIFKHFGHPRELQEQYEQSLWVQHHQKERTGIRVAIVVICAACLLLLTDFLIYSYDKFREVNGHGEITLHIIETPKPNTPSQTPPPVSIFYIKE